MYDAVNDFDGHIVYTIYRLRHWYQVEWTDGQMTAIFWVPNEYLPLYTFNMYIYGLQNFHITGRSNRGNYTIYDAEYVASSGYNSGWFFELERPITPYLWGVNILPIDIDEINTLLSKLAQE